MPNRINPPKQVVLPAKVQGDRDLKKAFDDVYFILFQMWKRVGGGDDWIDQLRQDEYEFDTLIEPSIKDELLRNVVITDADYTTHTNQIVICTDSLTVTLNDEPEDQELASIRMIDKTVTLNGNGRTINGFNTAKMRIKYTSWDVMYIKESDEWIII